MLRKSEERKPKFGLGDAFYTEFCFRKTILMVILTRFPYLTRSAGQERVTKDLVVVVASMQEKITVEEELQSALRAHVQLG